VEAGKKAAASILALQGDVVAALSTTPQTADQIAARLGTEEHAETVYLLLEHLAANGRARISGTGQPAQATFSKS
jgi:glucose-6-phosphate isomerase